MNQRLSWNSFSKNKAAKRKQGGCRTLHGVRGLKYVKGDDVVVESSSGEFVTILKGGVTNARVKNARKSKI